MIRNLARRWSCLILGGALLMPYMMVGSLIAGLGSGRTANLLLLPAQVGVFFAMLPVVAVTGLFLPIRGLEVSAAQGLLGARVLTPPRQPGRSWQERRRTAAWFTLHLGVGGVVSGCTLAIVPFTIFTVVVFFTGPPTQTMGLEIAPGWNAFLWALAGVALLAGLVALAAGAGALLARLAPVLLGPTPAERLAAAEEHARALAERNRLARELHDSVGHALSVVTLQAAAAGRVLDRGSDGAPQTARSALAAIEQSARAALADLDHVLGLLRDDDAAPRTAGDPSDGRPTAGDPSDSPRTAGDPSGGTRTDGDTSDSPRTAGNASDGPAGRPDDRRGRAPQATLDDLGDLITTSGASVDQQVGDLSEVPAVVSREAYRIVQEALTNAIKHGAHGPIRLTAAVHGGDLRVEVVNPCDGRRGDGIQSGKLSGVQSGIQSGVQSGGLSGGRGLAGMRERVRLLRGDLEAGPTETGWRVAARLPLRSSP
ncbi:histidine kinase [Nonomuraea fastidiosa]|uniref:sensor histidine kinase n=1 Tax=Nonomuraea fastidiosa TaxID=46173 RepID=UPI00366D348D